MNKKEVLKSQLNKVELQKIIDNLKNQQNQLRIQKLIVEEQLYHFLNLDASDDKKEKK